MLVDRLHLQTPYLQDANQSDNAQKFGETGSEMIGTLTAVLFSFSLFNKLDEVNSFYESPEIIFGLSEDSYDFYEKNIWKEKAVEDTVMYSTRNKVYGYGFPDTSGEPVFSLRQGEKVEVKSLCTKRNGEEFYLLEGDSSVFVPREQLTTVEPTGYILDAELIYQNPELRNGCEVTSLTMALHYLGDDVDKCDLADNYLPKSNTLLADPNEYYLRNPRTNGFYCFAGPLIKCVENYNEAAGTDYVAKDLTGCEPEVMYASIKDGTPVVIWGTILWYMPVKLPSGLYNNLHCLLLIGYDDTTVTINDPIYGVTTIDKEVFESVWTAMGKRAITVSIPSP